MVQSVATLIGVLAAAALLGAAVWIVGIVELAHVVSRPVIGPVTLVTAAVALVATAIAYVVIVVLIGAVLAT